MNTPESERSVEQVQPSSALASAWSGIERFHCPAIILLLIASGFSLVFELGAAIDGDLELYRNVGESISKGVMPYRDSELEYPPYSIPLFLIPWTVSRGASGYQLAFGLFIILVDSLLKSRLLLEGIRRNKGAVGFLPLALYCVSVPFIKHLYLHRYDLFPAVLTVAALVCFVRGWPAWSGAILAIAAGVKLYPVLLVPVFGMLALRRGLGPRFASGLGGASLPLIVLSFFLPWWEFLSFHGQRGLQAESVYAATLWLGRLLGFVDVQWRALKEGVEVIGPLASLLTPWAKGLMLVTTLGSVGFATWMAGRRPHVNQGELARLSLIPLLAFVGFGIVLSPQFLIWLLPLAAFGLPGGRKWPMLVVAAAVMVTPIIYPGRHYGSGLILAETLVLLIRNLGLLVVWGALIAEFWEFRRKAASSARDD
jgi:hypothetical protein